MAEVLVGLGFDLLIWGTTAAVAAHRARKETVQVTWSDATLKSKLGTCSIRAKDLIKCHPSEVFQIDDHVEATCDLTYKSGVKIATGSYGVVKGFDDQGNLSIRWLAEETENLLAASSIYLKNCNHKFHKIGDVVQAKYDLTYGENDKIPKGTHGTLKGYSGTWTVDWWNGVTDVSTEKEHLLTCDQSKFYKAGEVVKAKLNLALESKETISAGSLLTLTSCNMKENTWNVNWSNGTSVRELVVKREYLKKCQYTEYWLPNDVLKTRCDIKFSTPQFNVPKGSLCKLA